MKPNPFLERLHNSPNAPFYQCPRCHTVWLVMGVQASHPYTCKQCHHQFDLAQARYTRVPPDKDDLEVPKAV